MLLLRQEKEAFGSGGDNEGFDCIVWQWDEHTQPRSTLYSNCEGQRR